MGEEGRLYTYRHIVSTRMTPALRWAKRESVYLSLHCHHQNDSCIKMASDESHFNVSLIVRDKVTRQCPQTTTFDEKSEPKWI